MRTISLLAAALNISVAASAQAGLLTAAQGNVLFTIDDVSGVITRCETVFYREGGGGSRVLVDCKRAGRMTPTRLAGNLTLRFPEGGAFSIINRATKATTICFGGGGAIYDPGRPDWVCKNVDLAL